MIDTGDINNVTMMKISMFVVTWTIKRENKFDINEVLKIYTYI